MKGGNHVFGGAAGPDQPGVVQPFFMDDAHMTSCPGFRRLWHRTAAGGITGTDGISSVDRRSAGLRLMGSLWTV